MNYTNSSSPSPSAIIDETVCLYDMYPCSLTWTGNLFLLLIYGGILAWGAKQINLGSDKLLEVFPPGLIGGVLLPVLGALPDATVIFFSVINASGADAQEQLNVGMGTLAGSNIILLTMPWAIALLVGRVPLVKTKSGRKKARYHHPHSKKQKARRKTLIKQAVQNDAQRRLSKNRSKALQKKKEKALVLFQKKEALKKIFLAIDTNNNGTIERKEFMKAVAKKDIIDMIEAHESLKGFLKPKWFNEFFDNMDKNSNKHISLDEFLEYAMQGVVVGEEDDDEGDDVKLLKTDIINDFNDGGTSTDTSSSSDSESSTSEDEEDDVIILEQVKETTKRELTMRDMAIVLKETDKNASNNNNAMPLTSLNGWFNTGITVFVSVRRTSLIMLCTMLPFVVVQLFATLQWLGVSSAMATQIAGLVGFFICIFIFVFYSWDAMHNDKQKKALLRRAQKKREWLNFLDTVKRANNHGGLDTVITAQFTSQVAKDYEAQIRKIFKESRRQNRTALARRHRYSMKAVKSHVSRMNLEPKDYVLKKLEMTGENAIPINDRASQSLAPIHEEGPDAEGPDTGKTNSVDTKAVAINISNKKDDGDKIQLVNRPHSHRILGRQHSTDHGSSTSSFSRSDPQINVNEAQTLRSFSNDYGMDDVVIAAQARRNRSQSASSLLATLSVGSLPAVRSNRFKVGGISSNMRTNIHNNLVKIRDMQKMTDELKENMDPHAYDEMRMALIGWAHKKSYKKAIFDAWKAAVEVLNDEDAADGESQQLTRQQERKIMLNGFGLIALGTLVIMFFADPLVNTISRFGKNINVSSFFISMVAVPIASNASELISSVLFARRKRKKELSLIYSMLYGGVVMNNALCLGVFLLLLYSKGLVWRFGSETLSLLVIAISIGLYGTCRRTYPSYMAVTIGSMFPLSVVLVLVFRIIFPGM